MSLPENSQLSDFEILNIIAAGSFGKVYLVKHTQTGAIFAMKKMSKIKMIMMRQVQHLQQETSILRQINSPFIVKMHKCFQTQEHVVMIFDFVPGGELFVHLRAAEKFPTEAARFYVAETATAIGYCHDKLGAIYRDLKPENILLDKKGHVKLTDFGFAKQTQALTFTLLGTPEYLSPEVLKCTGHHKSTDWWSLGILTYELLVGCPPFYDEDENKICQKILAGKISFPRGMDPQAQDFIIKLLNIDKDKRLGANVQTGTKDVKSHAFFTGLNWSYIEKKLVKAPIIPPSNGDADLSLWADAATEMVEDDDEIKEMQEAGDSAAVPGSQEQIDAMFSGFQFD